MFPESIILSPETIEDLSHSANTGYWMLTEECKELQFEAHCKNSECIVSVTDGSRLIHLSVSDGKVNYFWKIWQGNHNS